MRNLQLYEAFKEYCKEALVFLNAKLKSPEDLPTTIKEKFEVTEDGGISQFYVTEVEWWRLVLKNEQSIKQTDVYQRAIQAMGEDKRVARHLNALVGTGEMKTRVEADSCLQSLFSQLLHEQQGLSFQEAIFDKIYKRIEDYFYRGAVEYRCLATLNNFQMEIEGIELNPKFFIIKIPKEEREKMLSRSSQFGLFSAHHVMPFNEYAFELYTKASKVIGDGSSDPEVGNMPSQLASKQFDEACSALRLFKKGAINYNYIEMKTTSWQPHGGSYTVGSAVSRPSIGTRYILSKEEIQSFLKFWKFFQKVRQKRRPRIENALRRFNFGYERVRPEDKLIDYLIGFESLLLKPKEQQELGYRLGLRGSILLGKTSDERKRIFKELRTAYGERSNIVHGRAIKEIVKIGTEKIQFNEFVDRVEEHLRLAIKGFLIHGKSLGESQVIDSLDERIVASF